MFSDEEIMSSKFADENLIQLINNFIVGMVAKYSRQASLRAASSSTPTAAKSFQRQFSHQQSSQVVEKPDDEKVWYFMWCACMCVAQFVYHVVLLRTSSKFRTTSFEW